MVTEFDLILPAGQKKRTLQTLLKQVQLNTGLPIQLRKPGRRLSKLYIMYSEKLNDWGGLEEFFKSAYFFVDNAKGITHINMRISIGYMKYLELALIKSAEDLGFSYEYFADIRRFPWYGKLWEETFPLAYVLKEDEQYEELFKIEELPIIYI
jgi:hypothetical protein